MRNIREVYSESAEAKAQYAVQPQTITQIVDALMDAMFGPSEYSYVSIMNAVADRLSERGFALATTDPLMAQELCRASCEIGMAAEQLDRRLLEQSVTYFKEAN